jgi:hypothetical protein
MFMVLPCQVPSPLVERQQARQRNIDVLAMGQMHATVVQSMRAALSGSTQKALGAKMPYSQRFRKVPRTEECIEIQAIFIARVTPAEPLWHYANMFGITGKRTPKTVYRCSARSIFRSVLYWLSA